MKFKRIFVIVCDSLGIGYDPKAKEYGDEGANTYLHIANSMPNKKLDIPTLNSLGLNDLENIPGTSKVNHPQSYVTTLLEASKGKDTMTGHWEMMGIKTAHPFKTFTDTGFPKELIEELEAKWGRKIIGNIAASGTEIIKQLGPQQMKDGSLIVYTSSDSVLQVAANTSVVPLSELYKDCEIAREIVNRPEYRLGRVIARPYIGTDPSNFKRTADRYDYALKPTGRTAMDDLKDAGFMTSCVGKIANIFDQQGVTKTVHTVSDQEGMEITLNYIKNDNFTGLCFVNLVEFDSEYGHRRNPVGYGNHIQDFDKWLKPLLEASKEDDLIMITADHGKDPTWHGTDHTRERVPLLMYSKLFKEGKELAQRKSFADIGATVLANFNVSPSANEIGTPIEEILK